MVMFLTLLDLFHLLPGTLMEELGFPEIRVPAEPSHLLIFRLSWALVTNFYGKGATAPYLQLQPPARPTCVTAAGGVRWAWLRGSLGCWLSPMC